ncbi:MAG: hypothetical protein LBV23_10140 [Deltaproteobacteria bacterium]|jgi:predicted Zn finger-like uncharacterized protein|nr:hypothetical protein [Deltaproteobacteria bacterium]
MTIKCPNCLTLLKVAQSTAQLSGRIWLRCPKCGERFQKLNYDFMKLAPKYRENNNQNRVNNIANRKATKTDRSIYNFYQQPISYLETSPYELAYDHNIINPLDSLPVHSPYSSGQSTALAVAILAVASIILGLGFIFSKAYSAPKINHRSVQTLQGFRGYDLLQRSEDLRTIFLDITKNSQVSKFITYRGHESRLVKFYLTLLAPYSCEEISAVKIWSTRTSKGFMAEGVCNAPGLDSATLEVLWPDNEAIIRVVGAESSETLPLNLSPPPIIRASQ